MKSEVLTDLPKKQEIVLPVPLRWVCSHAASCCGPRDVFPDGCVPCDCCSRSGLQIHYYQEVLARNYDLLHRNVKAAQRVSLRNVCMQLRKVCGARPSWRHACRCC
jgi:hypothetical protein